MSKTILDKYTDIGIKFYLDNDNLKLDAPKGIIDEGILSDLKKNKPFIIEAIKQRELLNSIPKAKDKEYYNLSSSQYGIWAQSLTDSGNAAYNMASLYSIDGEISLTLLENSFKKIIEKYEVLRTNIILHNNTPFQKIKSKEKINFNIELIPSEENLENTVKKEVSKAFNLENDLLFRVVAFIGDDEKLHLIIIVHHIILDGLSIKLLFNELLNTYQKISFGESINTLEKKLQYKDYTQWEHQLLLNGKFEVHKEYWLQQFQGELEPVNLIGYQARPAIKTFSGKSCRRTIQGKAAEAFIAYGKQHGVSFFTNYITLLNVLLHRYTQQKDITIGAPFSLRNNTQLEEQLGLYIATYPIRTIIDDNDTYTKLLLKVGSIVSQSMDHTSYPLYQLVEDLKLKKDISRNPLFDILVSSQNGISEPLTWEGIEISEIPLMDNHSKFDLELYVDGEKDSINVLACYNTDIYKESFINQLLNHLENLMLEVVNNDKKISELSFLSIKEQEQILEDFNTTEQDHSGIVLDKIANFETLKKVAVADKTNEITYQQLKDLSDNIANNLNNNLSEDQTYVAVSIERSAIIIPVILGIFKSGRIYVPLDPILPEKRIKKLLQVYKIDALVSDKEWNDIDSNLISLQELTEPSQGGIILPNNIPESSKAYLIFTSGTTGLPKGVEINHAALNNFIESMKREPGIQEEDVLVSVTTYSFDISLLEFLGPLSVGATVYVAKETEIRDPQEWEILYAQLQPTIIQGTPSFYQMLFNHGWQPNPSLKLLSGGEPISLSLSGKILNALASYWNMYGPTETTIWSTIKKITNVGQFSTIGKPIDNTQVYLLDKHLNCVPKGVIGDFYIGGKGLAIGYKDNLDLTLQKFIKNPFKNDQHIYATGDLGKWNSDGEIVFLGRKDYQVKFRGYRIELTEIEYHIHRFSEHIKEAVVVLKQQGDNEMLIAFYTASESIDESLLEKHLRASLPFYMIPSHITKVERFELTPNGKIDRKKLTNVVVQIKNETQKEQLTDVEKKIQTLWVEVLGVENIGVQTSFFEIGGNSLNIAQILNRITQHFLVSMGYKEFVENPTIRLTAKNIANKNKLPSVFVKIPKIEKKECYELTRSQYRLWLTSKLGGSKAYNISEIYTVKELLNKEIFEQALRQIVKRHDSLRTTFKLNKNNEVYQYITPYEEYDLDFVHGEQLSENKIREIIKREIDIEIDLEKGPLFKAGLLGMKENTYVVYFLVHHIISDGWSMEVLQRELMQNYFFLAENNIPFQREKLSIQFQDYSTWLNNDLDEILQNQKIFWHSIFEKPIELMKLPFERPDRPLKKTYNGDTVVGKLNSDLTQKLKAISAKLNTTTFSSLLSAFNILIYKYTGLNDITIGTPISGRVNNQLENQFGLYINTLPIRTDFNVELSFDQLNINQNKKLFEFYENQLYQIDQLIEELNIKVIPGRNPVFDMMIVYQNQANIKLFENWEEEKKYGIGSLQNSNINFQSQFDLSIGFSDNADGEMDITVFYNTDIFEKKHMEQFVADYCHLMEYRLRDSNNTPKNFFADTSYQFMNDKEIVFKKSKEQLLNEEMIMNTTEYNKQKNELKQILSTNLGKEIECNEDYFKSGGSSLKAINITNEINKKFNTNINIVDFYYNSSVNDLYNLITNNDSKINKFFPVVELLSEKHSADKDNVIFFPPIVGIGKIFKPLTNFINRKYNCYSLNVPIFEDELNFESKIVFFFDEITQKVKDIDSKTVLVGYSIGANFAFEIAKLFSQNLNIKVVLIDRPTEIPKINITKEIIKKNAQSQSILLEMAKQFSSEEDIYKRIEQTMKGLNGYEISGKLNAPIYAFECKDNEQHNYMEGWSKYTQDFKGVSYLKGNHLQALEEDNLFYLAHFFNTVLYD